MTRPSDNVTAPAAGSNVAPVGGTGTVATVTACDVVAEGPPLRLMVWPVKTWLVDVPPLLASVTVTVFGLDFDVINYR
jgi:hypothetical protein